MAALSQPINNPSSGGDNGKDLRLCPIDGCKKKMKDGYIHARCGHHIPQNGHCWTCEPQYAPEWLVPRVTNRNATEMLATSTTSAMPAPQAHFWSNNFTGLAVTRKVQSRKDF